MKQKTPLHFWNEKMRIKWLHRRRARLRKTVAVTFLIWPAFSYFFVLYGLATKAGSILVLRMAMATQWPGPTNTTKNLGIIEPVRMQKAQQLGTKRNNKYSKNYTSKYYFIRAKGVSNCYIQEKKNCPSVCVDVRKILVLVWKKLSWF